MPPGMRRGVGAEFSVGEGMGNKGSAWLTLPFDKEEER